MLSQISTARKFVIRLRILGLTNPLIIRICKKTYEPRHKSKIVQLGLSRNWSGTPKTDFLATRFIFPEDGTINAILVVILKRTSMQLFTSKSQSFYPLLPLCDIP